MNSVNSRHSLTPSGFGSKAKTIGNGGNFSTLYDAVMEAGNRLVLKHTETPLITIFVSATTILGTGTTWLTDENIRVGDFVEVNGSGVYYKIKNITTNTELLLHEAYAGSTIGFPAPVAAELNFYRLNWLSLILLPGEHNSPNTAEAVPLSSGLSICGLDKYTTVLSEVRPNPQSPFTNYGENILSNFTLAPTEAWKSMDAVQNTPDTTLWGGAKTFMDNMIIKNKDVGGDHGQGTSLIPVPAGGQLFMSNCHVEFEAMIQFQAGGRVTATAANTEVFVNGCTFEHVRSHWSKQTYNYAIVLAALYANENMRYRLHNSDFLFKQKGSMTSSIDDPAVIYANNNGIMDIVNCNIIADNTDGTVNGINVPSGYTPTINITNTNIEVESGTGVGTGILTEQIGCTVNLRLSRVKGDNSAITNTAGTVNQDQTTLVGGTTGTITALAT